MDESNKNCSSGDNSSIDESNDNDSSEEIATLPSINGDNANLPVTFKLLKEIQNEFYFYDSSCVIDVIEVTQCYGDGMVDYGQKHNLPGFDILSITDIKGNDVRKRSRFYLQEQFNTSDINSKDLITKFLSDACTKGGSPGIVRTGGSGEQVLRFKCPRHRKYHSNKSTPSKRIFGNNDLYANNVRGNKLVNERSMRRDNGLSLPKRSNVSRPITNEEKCKFLLPLYLDSKLNSWYFKAGVGCKHHNNHPKPLQEEISQPLRHLNKQSSNTASNAMDSNIGESSASAFMFKEKGIVLRPRQMQYIGELSRDINSSVNGTVLDSGSATDKMIQYMKNTSSISFIVLYHDPSTQRLGPNPNNKRPAEDMSFDLKYDIYNSDSDGSISTINAGHDDIRLINASIQATTRNVTNSTTNPSSSGNLKFQSDIDRHSLQDEIETTRVSKQVGHKKMLLAIAWVTEYEKRLFHIHPETLAVDIAENTNKEKRPMFLIASQDANNKTNIVMRAFFPHQRMWMFHWAMGYALPKLTGHHHCSLVRCFLSDGDYKIYNSIIDLFQSIFKNASYRRCHFHLVKQELRKLLRSCGIILGGNNDNGDRSSLFYEIEDWITCFYTYYETEEEFNAAKVLLFQFIDGNQMKKVFGQQFVDGIRDYCISKYFPHFAHFAFYLHNDKLNFERKTSCSVEGMIHGMKQKKSGLTSNMTVDNSVQKINEQAEQRQRINAQESYNSLGKSPIWSKTGTAPYVTPLAEAILQNAWNERTNYTVLRTKHKEFYVSRNKPSDTKSSKLAPLFARYRIVSIHATYISCTCKKWERCHIVCTHILSVADCVVKSFIGLRWFKFFCHYYEKNNIPVSLQNEMDNTANRFPKHCYLCPNEINQILDNQRKPPPEVQDPYPYFTKDGNILLQQFKEMESKDNISKSIINNHIWNEKVVKQVLTSRSHSILSLSHGDIYNGVCVSEHNEDTMDNDIPLFDITPPIRIANSSRRPQNYYMEKQEQLRQIISIANNDPKALCDIDETLKNLYGRVTSNANSKVTNQPSSSETNNIEYESSNVPQQTKRYVKRFKPSYET